MTTTRPIDGKFAIRVTIDHGDLSIDIINRATGVAIPPDEPVFLLRAKDMAAVGTLAAYKETSHRVGADRVHTEDVLHSIERFMRFSQEHRDRMKVPDTIVPAPAADREGGVR